MTHCARLLVAAFVSLAALAVLSASAADKAAPTAGLTMVVMDPLCLPLSCPCVQGYAQRDYDKLARYLEGKLGRPVTVAYSDSLTAALKTKTEGKADLVIGKRSVVEYDAKANHLDLAIVADLTGKDGLTTMTGLIVVPKDDPARKAADLQGYRIIFGTLECDEKYAAPMALLKSHGVAIPAKPETSASCADGAEAILAAKAGRGAAVISSYAKPLLEGCGTIQKGDLRVVAETAPVPFISAFVSSKLSQVERDAVAEALLKIHEDPILCRVLETRLGFVPPAKQVAEASKKK